MAADAYRSHAVSRGLLDSGSRPFGSRLAGQDVLYFLYLPVLLSFGAVVAALAPSNGTFVFGSIVGGLVGLYLMLDLIVNDPPLRVSSLLAMSLLVAYDLGSVSSWLTVPRANLTISEAFARDPVVLANGVAASMAVCAVLLFVGQLWERPIFGGDFCLQFDARSFLFIVAATSLVVIAFATGKIGFMGAAVSEDQHPSAFGVIVAWLAAPSLAYSVCAALNTKGLFRLVAAACSIIQTFSLVPTGRRNFAFALLLTAIVSRLGRFRLRLSFFGKALMLAIGLVLVVIASVGFLYLRVAGWEHKEATSLSARVQAAEQLLQTRSISEMTQYLQANASTRTFEIGYFADLVDASQSSTPLLGRGLVRNLKLIIPSAISRDKLGVESYQEEGQVDMQFGFSYEDEANTVLTAGAADFGLLGVFVYPLAIVLLMRAATELVQAYFPTYVAAIISFAFINQMLSAEANLSDYLLQLRHAAIVAGIFYLLSLLPRTGGARTRSDGPLFRDKPQRLIGT